MFKRKSTYSVISVFMAVLMIVLSVVSPVGAISDTLTTENVKAESFAGSFEKLSQELREKLSVISNEDVVDVYVFLKKLDKETVSDILYKRNNRSMESYEDKNRFYKEVVPKLVVENNRTIEDIVGTNNVNSEYLKLSSTGTNLSEKTKKDINNVVAKEIKGYVSDKRNVYLDLSEDYVDDFMRKHNIDKDDLLFDTKYIEVIIVRVTKEQVLKMASDSLVENIGIYRNEIETPFTCDAVPLIQGDSTTGLKSEYYINFNDNINDGAGITIGIIEANRGRYDPTNYNLVEAHNNGRLQFVATPGVSSSTITSHATNVTSIICGKKTTINGKTYEGFATGSTIYQTGIFYTDDVYNAIQMFGNMDVNIINYSGGRDNGEYYSEYDQMIDYYVENLNMSIVVAAGNTQQTDYVCSPGKAYNVITVGNLNTKNDGNTALTAPYYMAVDSVYTHSNYLSNKPDVVAPGSNIHLPVSSTQVENIYSGTSFAAPMVTGIAAQLMTDELSYVVNPNSLKNIIICGASNAQIQGTTIAYGELRNESGAGLVNAINSQEAKDNEFYGVYPYTYTNTEYETIEDIYLRKGQTIRIVLTFEKEEDILLSEDEVYGNNIDIRLAQTLSFTTHAESKSTNNNVEVIEFKARSSGTYNLQIRLKNSILTASDNSDLRYWISWRIY